MIRLLLVDDQPAVLQGLRMRLELEQDLVVVGEAEDGQTAVGLALARHPDVVVLDLGMPGLDGPATAAALKAQAPGTAIVMLSYPSRRGRMRPGKKLAWDEYNRHWSPDKQRPCPPWCVTARC